MASARRDDLAKRLAERLDKAPAKGRAMSAPVGDTRSPMGRRNPPDGTPRSAAGARTGPTAPKRAAPKRAAPKRAAASGSSSRRADERTPRPRRGAAGTVLRGHLVPDSIHADARRRKVTLRSMRGARITWDDVLAEGLAMLVGRDDRVGATLDDVRRADHSAVRRRLVQANLPADLDQGLVEIQLDLGDDPDNRAATYEQLWTAAIMLWLDSTE